MGHFDQFPAISSTVGYLFGQETLAGVGVDGSARSPRKTSLLRDAPINVRAPSPAMASAAGSFAAPSGIREPSPRRGVSAVEDRVIRAPASHLSCRRSWSRSEPRTHGPKVWTTKSRLVARLRSSIEHRRTWVRSHNLHF